MLHALLVLASTAGEEETSKTAFYVAGGALAAFAVLLAAIGMSKPDFPGSEGAARGIMGLTVLLVAGAVATSIVTG